MAEATPERPVRLSFSGLQVQFDALQADWNKYQSNQLRSRPTSRVEQNGEEPAVTKLAAVAEEGSPVHLVAQSATVSATRQQQRNATTSNKKPSPAAPTVPRRSGPLSNRSKSTPRGMSGVRKPSLPAHAAASPSPQPMAAGTSEPSQLQHPRAVSVGRLVSNHTAGPGPAQPTTAPPWTEMVPSQCHPVSPSADSSTEAQVPLPGTLHLAAPAQNTQPSHLHLRPNSATPASPPFASHASPTKGNISPGSVRVGPSSPPLPPRQTSPNRMSRILYSTHHHQHAADDLTCHHAATPTPASVPRATSCTQERNHHAADPPAAAPTRSKIPRSMFQDPASASGDLSGSTMDTLQQLQQQQQQHVMSSPRRALPRETSLPDSTAPPSMTSMAAAAIIAAPNYRSPTKRRQWDTAAAAATALAAAAASNSNLGTGGGSTAETSSQTGLQQKRVPKGQTNSQLPTANGGGPSTAAHSSQQNVFLYSDLPPPQRHSSTGTLTKLHPHASAGASRVSAREVPPVTAAAGADVGEHTGYRQDILDPSFRASPGVTAMPSFIGWSAGAASQAANAWANPLPNKVLPAAAPVTHRAVARHRIEAKSGWQHVDGSVASSIDAHPLPWTATHAGSSSSTGGHTDDTTTNNRTADATAASTSLPGVAAPLSSMSSSAAAAPVYMTEDRGAAAEPASSAAAAAGGDHMSRQGGSAPYRARDSALYMRKLSALKRGPSVTGDGATSSRRVSDSNGDVGRAAGGKEVLPGVGAREKRESNGFPTPVPEDMVLSDDDHFPMLDTANSAQQTNPSLPAVPAAAPYNVSAARQSLISNLLKARKRVSHGGPFTDSVEISDSAPVQASAAECPADSDGYSHASGAEQPALPLLQHSSSPPGEGLAGPHSQQQFLAYAVQHPDMAVAAAAVAVEASSRRERARWQVPPPQPQSAALSNPEQQQQQLSSLLAVGESWVMTNSVDIAAVLGSTGLYHTDTHGAEVWQADASEPWQAEAGNHHHTQQQHQQPHQHGHQQYVPSSLSNGGGGQNGESTQGTMSAIEFVRGQQEWQQQQRHNHDHQQQHQQQQQQQPPQQPSWEQNTNLPPPLYHNSRPEQQQQQTSSFYPLQPLQPAPATRAPSPTYLRLLQQNHPAPVLPQQMGPAWQVLPPTNSHARISGGGDGGPWVNSSNNGTNSNNGSSNGYSIGSNSGHNNYPSAANAHQLPRSHWQDNIGLGPPLYPPMPSTFSEVVHRNGLQSAQQLRSHQQQQQHYQQQPQQLQALEGYNGNPGYVDPGVVYHRRVSNPSSEAAGGAPDLLPDYLRQSRSKLTTGWSASPHEAQQGSLSAFADVWSQKFNHHNNNNGNNNNGSNNNSNNNNGNSSNGNGNQNGNNSNGHGNHNGNNGHGNQNGSNNYGNYNGGQPQSQRNTGNGRQGTEPGSSGMENARPGPLGNVQLQGQQGLGYNMTPAGRGREGFEGLSLSEVLASKPKREVPNFKKKSTGMAPVVEAAT